MTDLSREREDFGTCTRWRSDCVVLFSPMTNDPRNRGKGLAVVNERGVAPESGLRRIGRT